jgi:hypothetical protein
MSWEQPRRSQPARGRRRFPRLAVDGNLHVRDLTLDLAMHVEDVSYGGCRTVSPIDLPIGSQHTFHAALAGREPLPLTARVVHCRPMIGPQGPYAVGWQWSPDPVTARSITRIIDALTDARSFVRSSLDPRPGASGRGERR